MNHCAGATLLLRPRPARQPREDDVERSDDTHFAKFLAEAQADLDQLRRLADALVTSEAPRDDVPNALWEKIAEQERFIERMRPYDSASRG